MKNILLLFSALLLISSGATAQSGITWSMAMDVASSSSGNMHPRVVVDAAGDPMLVWGHAARAMFSRWNGTGFTMPLMLNTPEIGIASASWMGPDIASKGDTVYVVMKRVPEASDTCHIYIVHSFDGGITFTLPVQVDFIADSISRFPTVTVDETGNPIVGFMKFDPSFGDARWVVTKSSDFGNTFTTDVKASGWSGAGALVCDCCPGSITSSGNSVTMLYRDNLNNIRDSWTGLSSDGGASFSSGWNIDLNNWNLFACQATGPDGVIIGDSLYSVFMNGASGMGRVYRGASSISSMMSQQSQPVTATIPGLSIQNYPRIDKFGNSTAIVWTQNVNGADQLPVLFTNNINNGFPSAYDTVDLGDVINADVALSNGNMYVVWEDDNTGTVRYRKGTFIPAVTSVNESQTTHLSVFPNPSTDLIKIGSYQVKQNDQVELQNVFGEKINVRATQNVIDISKMQNGIYFLRIISGNQIFVSKFIKQ